jgi:hypothetical protein
VGSRQWAAGSHWATAALTLEDKGQDSVTGLLLPTAHCLLPTTLPSFLFYVQNLIHQLDQQREQEGF